MKRGILRFREDVQRWRFSSDSGEYEYDMHCGDGVEIMIGAHYVHGRMEMDHDWYIIMPNARFHLMRRGFYIARMT